jgi:hypothetical protein
MKIIVYGHAGWIGTQFIELLQNTSADQELKPNTLLHLLFINPTPQQEKDFAAVYEKVKITPEWSRKELYKELLEMGYRPEDLIAPPYELGTTPIYTENVSPPYSYENNIYNKYQAVKLHGNNLNSYGSNNEYYTSNNNGDNNMNNGGNWRNNQQYASAGLQGPQNWGNYQGAGQGWGFVAPGAGGGKSNWRNNSWRNYQGQSNYQGKYNYQGQSNYQGKYNYQGAEYHEQENSGEESNNNHFKGTTYEQFVEKYVPIGGTSLLKEKWDNYQKLQKKKLKSSGGTKKKLRKKSTRRK